MNNFFTFEGGEGSGKTTVSKLVIDKLGAKSVICTREPGGIPSAEAIREIILNEDINGIAECLLFAAARRQHLIEKVKPALENDKIVIMDRYIDSSLVYQGIARGLNVDGVFLINKLAINNEEVTLSDYILNQKASVLAIILTEGASRHESTVIGDKIKAVIEKYQLDDITKLLLLASIHCVNSRNTYTVNLDSKIDKINDFVNELISEDAKLFIPTATFILDIEPEKGLNRILSNSNREVNRLDKENLDFHHKIRDGYSIISNKYSYIRNIFKINADRLPEEVAVDVYTKIKQLR